MKELNKSVIEVCAAAAHMANRAYCHAIGDDSQPLWEEAPQWQKNSARVGVIGVLRDGNGPGASHASWLKEKEADGWKYGPVKDPEKKEHPCFVPFDQLPPEQQAKDYIFVDTVKQVCSAIENWKAVPLSKALYAQALKVVDHGGEEVLRLLSAAKMAKDLEG